MPRRFVGPGPAGGASVVAAEARAVVVAVVDLGGAVLVVPAVELFSALGLVALHPVRLGLDLRRPRSAATASRAAWMRSSMRSSAAVISSAASRA